MISIVGLFGLVAFIMACLVVGARITRLAIRTRLLPETTIGLSLFLAGGVGTGLTILPLFLTSAEPSTKFLIYQVGSAVSHVGWALLYLFVWRVFRPTEGWAVALYGLCTTALLVGGIGLAVSYQVEEANSASGFPNSFWFWLSLGSRFVAYGWAAIESYRYYVMLKRRLRLGLADADVASRFLYWAVSLSAVFCIWVNLAVRQLCPDIQIVQSTSYLISSLLGYVVAGSLWFAFFPRRTEVSEHDADMAAAGTSAQ